MTEPAITLYDIPSTLTEPWSPNTLRARFALNLKKIPYNTIWIEYPDIADLCKQLGVGPTSTNPDGSPYYSLPVIQDSSTGAVIADSPVIAKYLDTQYPDTPKLFPDGTDALQYGFISAYSNTIGPLFQFSVPQTNSILRPRSEAYFRRTREHTYNVPKLEELVPTGDKRAQEWANFEKGLGKVDEWYSKSSGPFLMGENATFADLTVIAFLVYAKVIWGKDSSEWEDIRTWDGGRWEGLANASFTKYNQIN